MNTCSALEAKNNLFELIDKISRTHQPIRLEGENNNAILLSEEEYEGLQETLYLYSVPGLVERILEASNEPLDDCVSHEEAWK